MTCFPIPFDEERRHRVLHQTGALDGDGSMFGELTAAAVREWSVPIVTVSLVDRDRQCFKGAIGLDAPETGRDVALCSHTILGEKVMVVPDASTDGRFANNPLVTGDLQIRFYAGAPIRVDGAAIGSFCLIDPEPRTNFGEKDEKRLQAYAEIAGRLIEKSRMDRFFSQSTDMQLEDVGKDHQLDAQERAAFLAVISHELRTPLAAIKGFADVLRSADGAAIPPETRQEYMQMICTGAEQLNVITESALQLAAADFGSLPIEWAECDLGEIAYEGLRLVQIDCDVSELNGWKVRVDDRHFRQFFANVAASLMTKGAETIDMSAKIGREGELCVGIDPHLPRAVLAELDRALEPFQYEGHVLNRGRRGLELDLALADRLVKAHGCRFRIAPETGSNAQLALTLPAYLVQ